MKRFALYLLRWQASTIILAPCIALLANYGAIISAVVGNFIGGCIFYLVDKKIFKEEK